MTTYIDGNLTQEGPREATITVKQEPVREEFEMYNFTQDPTELANLANNPGYSATFSTLLGLLVEQRRLKRLTPAQQKRLSLPAGGIGV